MTDIDRFDHESYDDISELDGVLDEWDDYSDDETATGYEDFLDWLNERA